MRTIIVSLSLFAVVLAYIVLSPSDKPTTTTSQKTMAEEKAGNEGKTTSARSVLQKASEADWAAVHAIAAEYAPQLKEMERKRNKEEDSFIGSYEPKLAEYVTKDEYKAKHIISLAHDMANKAIRDLEREQWARMSEYLSPYELREYKLEHSQLARDMRPELEWFQPSKGEFVALYTYREKRADFLDEMFGGNTKLYSRAYHSANDRRMAIQHEVTKAGRTRRALEDGRQRMDALEGKDIDTWRAELDLQAMASKMMGGDRWESFSFGPYGQKRKSAMDELVRQDRLHSQRQISGEELSLARHKFSLVSAQEFSKQLEGNRLSEEGIAKELKWYREVVLELPPAENKAADD